jgi:2-polyprenyl-3-methyl-5-hydroxy-6-metoxy-1,4-benzoquinol methylase
MISSFRHRDTALRELMDDPDCDPVKLRRTYRQFAVVNRLFSAWRRVFNWWLLPLMLSESGTDAGAGRPQNKPLDPSASASGKKSFTLLDVGCGLMDNGLNLRRLAAGFGIELHVTGIDPGHEVDKMMEERSLPEGVRFEPVYLQELVDRGEKFDFVISNHLLHHLNDDEVVRLLVQVAQVTRCRAVMNDLSRSVISWAFFGAVSWPARGWSFLAVDGMRSIRRSYRAEELRALVPEGVWQVCDVWPFRQIVVFDGHGIVPGGKPAVMDGNNVGGVKVDKPGMQFRTGVNPGIRAL